MKSIIPMILFLAQSGSGDATVSMGNVTLMIPRPHGFAVVTPEMKKLYEFLKTLVPPPNEQLTSFISEADVPAAEGDELPNLARRFSVQTGKSLLDRSVSRSDFSQLKKILRSQNDEVITRVTRGFPGLMELINKGFPEKYDVHLAFSLSEMIPRPVHADTDRIIAYSAYVKYNVAGAPAGEAEQVATVTVTAAHVKGRVVYLYAYAQQADLEWTREASEEWTNAIIASNPSDPAAAATEAGLGPTADSNALRIGAVVGAGMLVVLLIGGMAWARTRNKAS